MRIRDERKTASDIFIVEPEDAWGNFATRSGDRINAQTVASSGVAGFSVALALCWSRTIYPSEGYVLLSWFLGLTLTPMICLHIFVNKVHLRESTGLASVAGPLNRERCMTKYVGLLLTVMTLAGCYWLFPEYRKPFYDPCWKAARVAALPGLALAFVYIAWVDRRMKAPYDAYWHLGRIVLSPGHAVDYHALGCHAASWAVKGFFLPFMLAGGTQNLEALATNGLNFHSFDDLYVSGLNLVFALDVTFGALGYLLTLRMLDAQIRTTDPTVSGWLAALCCYPPFGPFLQAAFLNYHGPVGWQERWPWTLHPVLYVSWGFAVLMLQIIYVWATCSFGCRFSNLTNRGIIVDGPYRFFKHPAYLCKNLAWWLMYVPFAAFGTWQECLRACLLLGGTNLIYVARAWTEERHLCIDPAYIEYSLWMNEHSLYALLRKRLSRLRNGFLKEAVATEG